MARELHRQMEQQECDVVYGVQAQRKGKAFERCSGQLFYRLFNLLSGLSMSESIVVARLMSRRCVNALLRHEERELFIAGLWHIVGFDQRPQIIHKLSSGMATYTLR